MGRRNHPQTKSQARKPRPERRVRVVGVRRDDIDRRKLSRVLLGLAAAEAEHAARHQHATNQAAQQAVPTPDIDGGDASDGGRCGRA
jgi:hypothetical protein